MIKSLKVLCFILLFYSCGGDDFYETEYKVTNKSGFTVIIKVYSISTLVDSTSLFPKDSWSNYSGDEGVDHKLPLVIGDSVLVSFNDTIQIMHIFGDSSLICPKRNITDENNYQGGKVGETKYEYEYIITNDDFIEAVECSR